MISYAAVKSKPFSQLCTNSFHVFVGILDLGAEKTYMLVTFCHVTGIKGSDQSDGKHSKSEQNASIFLCLCREKMSIEQIGQNFAVSGTVECFLVRFDPGAGNQIIQHFSPALLHSLQKQEKTDPFMHLKGRQLHPQFLRTALKPLSEESVVAEKASDGHDGFSGGHFRAIVKLDKTDDTFIDMSKWKKGTVYVNGHNIGRYWNVGPQLSLYCPAPFLVCGENTIDIIELELSEPRPIRGLMRPCYFDSDISTTNAANEW